MPHVAYKNWRPQAETLAVIEHAEALCSEYAADGYDLTLRQLYYRFVAGGIIENSERSYKRLGSIVNDARLAGLIDWDHITDRGREHHRNSFWSNPSQIIRDASGWWHRNLWEGQSERVEVWVEKQALESVVARVAVAEDVAYFACKGYTSQSEMWSAAQRLARHRIDGHDVTILHLGDHDPSGIDMTRDIEDRLETFHAKDLARVAVRRAMGEFGVSDVERGGPAYNRALELVRGCGELTVDRIALTMDQVEEYDPPPNPAKVTDSRYHGYRLAYGEESWELDALEPNVLAALITDHIERHRDADTWEEAIGRQEHEREILQATSDRWPDVVAMLEDEDDDDEA